MPYTGSVRHSGQRTSCERIYKGSTPSSSEKTAKSARIVIPKKTMKSSKGGKSCSAGVIPSSVKTPIVKPKKTTKSECFSDKTEHLFDYCGNCGDIANHKLNYTSRAFTESGDRQDGQYKAQNIEPTYSTLVSRTIDKKVKSTARIQTSHVRSHNIIKDDEIPCCSKHCLDADRTIYPKTVKDKLKKNKPFKPRDNIEQYYKNENFQRTSDSTQEIKPKKPKSLDTINELPEISTAVEDSSTIDSSCIFNFSSQSDDEDLIFDPDDYDSLRKLRDFREDNYFECHSVKPRVASKGSATSLLDHKCTYRFYLNDRLFPIPVNSDHNNNIRCSECHLPLDKVTDDAKNDVNGTIQAKVKLGSRNEAQDLVLMLPIKEPLIIKQKRKEIPKKENFVYFGVIKLDTYGNSEFNPILPADSLALKYQKGYKEYGNVKDYKYYETDECDVIVV